jgi:tripartite-type tricarboxylate transporter receptor subunit TctC
VTWYAVVAPPHTPAAVVEKINTGINEALRDSAVRLRLFELSAEAVGGTPKQAADYLQQESARWKNVITAAHVTLD